MFLGFFDVFRILGNVRYNEAMKTAEDDVMTVKNAVMSLV